MSVPSRQIARETLRPNARLWGATLVGVIALVCAFPAGMVLAVMNWQQMGLLRKARRTLYAAVALAYLFVVVLLLLPPGVAQIFYFGANIAAFFLLRRELDRDADAYAYAGLVAQPANPLVALAIGLGLLVLLILLVLATAVILVTVGLIHP